MVALNSTVGAAPLSASTTQNENIYTANANLNAPKKVGNRPVEPVPAASPAAPVPNAPAPTSPIAPALDMNAVKNMVRATTGMATTGSVGKNSLVQNQLNTILASGSPLLSRAKTDAAAASAERGLNNTSIGMQAGEEAMIRQALPIAQQDAQTYSNMDLANLDAKNKFGLTGMNQSFTDYNNDKNNAFTATENKLSRDQQTDLQKSQLEGNKELGAIKAQQDLAMQDIQYEHQRTLQSNQNAQSIFANHSNAVAQIMANPSMTPSQAGAAIKVLNATTSTNLDLIGKLDGVDLSAFKPTSAISGTSTTDKKGNVNSSYNVSDANTPAGQLATSNAGQYVIAAVGRSQQRILKSEAISRGLPILRENA